MPTPLVTSSPALTALPLIRSSRRLRAVAQRGVRGRDEECCTRRARVLVTDAAFAEVAGAALAGEHLDRRLAARVSCSGSALQRYVPAGAVDQCCVERVESRSQGVVHRLVA